MLVKVSQKEELPVILTQIYRVAGVCVAAVRINLRIMKINNLIKVSETLRLENTGSLLNTFL